MLKYWRLLATFVMQPVIWLNHFKPLHSLVSTALQSNFTKPYWDWREWPKHCCFQPVSLYALYHNSDCIYFTSFRSNYQYLPIFLHTCWYNHSCIFMFPGAWFELIYSSVYWAFLQHFLNAVLIKGLDTLSTGWEHLLKLVQVHL